MACHAVHPLIVDSLNNQGSYEALPEYEGIFDFQPDTDFNLEQLHSLEEFAQAILGPINHDYPQDTDVLDWPVDILDVFDDRVEQDIAEFERCIDGFLIGIGHNDSFTTHISQDYCFGRLADIPIKLHHPVFRPQHIDFHDSLHVSNQRYLRILPVGNVLGLVHQDGQIVAQLHDGVFEHLLDAMLVPSIQLLVSGNIEGLHTHTNVPGRPRSADMNIDIIVVGAAVVRDALGATLSKHKLYLQHPQRHIGNTVYDNPHMMWFDHASRDAVSLPRGRFCQLSSETHSVERKIKTICNGPTAQAHLTGREASNLVNVTLKPRQKVALSFMIQREIGPIPHDFSLWQRVPAADPATWLHSITQQTSLSRPSETGGGILADEMGMGKTLSALALVVETMHRATTWATSVSEDRRLRIRATLVVVPSLGIMDSVWLRQIETYLDTSTICIKYHGRRRHQKVTDIPTAAVVLTTYHTLAADRKRRSIDHHLRLSDFDWFRVILDEAHAIKDPRSTLYAAVTELQSCHNWCLTGTPIQNRVEELSPFLTFIRAEPLNKPLLFRKHIATPAFSGDDAAFKFLRALMNNVCLRRTNTQQDLLPLIDHEHPITLTEDEQRLYDQTLERMEFARTHSAPGATASRRMKSPYGRFQIALQLQLICNHGTHQPPFSWHHRDTMAEGEWLMGSMSVDAQLTCRRCKEKTLVCLSRFATQTSPSSGIEVLCDACETNESSPSEREDTVMQIEGEDDSVSLSNTQPASRNAMIDTNGFSSKIDAVVRHVEKDLSATKSIIFSCWTRTLDIIQYQLSSRNISTFRIDGTVAPLTRQATLKRFESNATARVLLITIGTGALGLDLTVANRVFLVEPSWNPSLELQAISRVQRFPQKQRVEVHRYFVQGGTIEQDIRRQQQSKLSMAARGFAS